MQPDCGVLAVNDSLQVEVTFKPATVGDHGDDLTVSYDTGKLGAPAPAMGSCHTHV